MKATEHVPVRVPQAGRRAPARPARMSVLFASGIVILSGCASGPFRPVIKTSALRVADQLVPFASCGDALRNLQTAASNAVTAEFAAASRSAGAAGGPAAPGSPAGQAAPAGESGAAAGQAGAGNSPRAAPSDRVASPRPDSGANTATPLVAETHPVQTHA